jgi:hypothetical protein
MNEVIRRRGVVVILAVMAAFAALSANAEQRHARRTVAHFEGRVEQLDRRQGTFFLSTRQGALEVEASRRDVERLQRGDRVVVTGVLDGDDVLIADRIDSSRGDRSWNRNGDHQHGNDDDGENDDHNDNDNDDEGDGD